MASTGSGEGRLPFRTILRKLNRSFCKILVPRRLVVSSRDCQHCAMNAYMAEMIAIHAWLYQVV